jgi:3-methyladenine DNA glycosylase AlkD
VPAAPSVKAVAADIVASLRRAADPAAAEQGQTYFKEPVRLLGVTAPVMRRLAREVYARVKPHWGLPEAVALCEALLPDPRLEVKAVGGLVCERFVRSFDESLVPRAQKWIERGWCDSWGMIDVLCNGVLGPLLLQQPHLAERTRPWTASPNRWLRRAAAVCLVKPARRGQLLDAAYDVARRLAGDGDDLVRKATGWLLREAGRTDLRRLERFLREHGPRLARVTVRYALERFPPDVRRRLLAETRGDRT